MGAWLEANFLQNTEWLLSGYTSELLNEGKAANDNCVVCISHQPANSAA